MGIEALHIHFRLCREKEVEEAVDFYKRHGVTNKDVLRQGSTNFDEKHYPDNCEEQPIYKTNLYIQQYMDMHIKQNLAVLRKYLSDTLKNYEHIVFVDFGCGPMTSGLALAEIASKNFGRSDYRDRISYLGIDHSENMVYRAQLINRQYQIFNQCEIVKDTKFHPEMMTGLPSSTNVLAILVLSFVLAQETYKFPKNEQLTCLENLAETWRQWVSRLPNLNETRTVYLNPLVPGVPPNKSIIHANWTNFMKALPAMKTDDSFSYAGGDLETITVPGLPKSVMAAQMIGKRKTNRSQ